MLTGAQRTHYRGLVKNRAPDLHLGQEGATPNVLKEAETAWKRSEVVKVRFHQPDRALRGRLVEEFAARTGSECVGEVGHTAAFFRPRAVAEES